jgi:hypothetical protein
MGDVVLFNGKSVPARVAQRQKGELSEMAKALAGGAAAIKRVSIKGGVWRLMHAGKQIAAVEERYLDVVLVNAAKAVSRKFFLKAYDPNDDTAHAPDCYSEDGVIPVAEAKNKQSDKCATCPKNIAGSGQGNSRACRFEHRVALVLANDIEGDVLAMSVPGASVFGDDGPDGYKPLKNYARYLAAQNVDPAEVITRMKFDTDAEAPKVFFKPMRWLEDDEYAIAQAKGKSDDAETAVKFTVAAIDKGAPEAGVQQELGARPQRSPEPEKPAAKPAAKPEPQPEPEKPAAAQKVDEEPPPPPPRSKRKAEADKPVEKVQAEPVEEPVVRKETARPNPVPAAKSNLAAMVDDWDDDKQ